MGRKKSKSKKAARKNLVSIENEYGKAPHTFVFNRGTVGKNVLQLMLDVRHVMEPYTASSLRTRKKNTLRDFVSVAGPLGVSHFISFTKTESSIHMRVMRLPRGPTLTFKVNKYSLAKDVISSLKKPSMYASQFLHHPLLVLNNFNGEELHFKLMTTMFQNMFPSINVNKIHLNDIRRCVLLNYNPETKIIELRHYSIKAVPVGMSRSAKKLMQSKVPNLGRYQDVSDFFLNAGQLSESEAEMDGEHNEVTLPQKLASRGNLDNQKSAIRLVEIGPRLQLRLIKIEEGLCEGEVLHHEFITKTKEEIAAARKMNLRKKTEKVKRRKQQDANVAKKQEERDTNKARSLEGIKKKFGSGQQDKLEGEADDVEDDDTEYYRQEVGQEPDADLFPKKRRKAFREAEGKPMKRPRFGSQSGDRKGNGQNRFGSSRGRSNSRGSFKTSSNTRSPGSSKQKFEPKRSFSKQRGGDQCPGRTGKPSSFGSQGDGRSFSKQGRGSGFHSKFAGKFSGQTGHRRGGSEHGGNRPKGVGPRRGGKRPRGGGPQRGGKRP